MLTIDGERVVRCRECGLLYQDPRPAEAIGRYHDNLYDDTRGADRVDERRRALFRGFLDRWPPSGRGRLLDVGCGSGEFLLQAQERGWRVTGVEVSARAIAVARRRGLIVHAGVAELDGDAFDAITLWNVVDFFSRPVEELRDVRRVLAPGGFVFIRTPNATYQLAAWRLSRILRWPPALAHLLDEAYFFQPIVWAPRTLRRLLVSAGLTDIRLWNDVVSVGDPYRRRSPLRDRIVVTVKRMVGLVAGIVYALSGGRLLIGSSLAARARKPA